ncbi:MAG: DNA primase, partial [Sphingomonadales bacterium]|nr:DNA primase [Sphingomonadales bacterium]
MRFPPEFLDEIRRRVSLVDVVAKRVKLTRKGREHTGLCPFHNEKTPSFTVSEEKGFYHCFGCGAHGDAIGFLVDNEGLPFPEAVENLAALAGVDVPQMTQEETEAYERRSTLYDVMEAAAKWYESQLAGAIGKSG